MTRKSILTLALLTSAVLGFAQRFTDKIDRGLVAVPGQSGGNFVSWRVLGEEYYDVTYNLYCNGSLLQEGLKVSSFSHAGGNASSKYQVAAVANGKEQAKSAEVTRWNEGYKQIKMAKVVDRNGNDVTSEYIVNDISLGDVDGDGIVEFMVKRNYAGDIRNASNKTKFHHYECYKLDGTRLWWIDLGPNMMAGPDEQWDLIAYDWDMDGKAECLMRGANNMIIHLANGNSLNIGNMNYIAPRDEYTREGAEYLLYMEGATCAPYGWDGSSQSFTPMAYPLLRFEAGETDYATAWGKNDTGHRSTKHYFGAPYFDGRKPSIFLGRGCYTRHKFIALDVDPATHELTTRWRWANNGGWSDPWFGNGYHNFAIGDVDWDGRDEIIFGSMIIDDNGMGLCTTGLGHGDAQHCADFDPYRKYEEQFTCNEDEPACTYYNATTGQIYYRYKTSSDDGRALCANFSNEFPGSMGRTTQTGMISTVKDLPVTGGPSTTGTNDALFWSHLNQRIYWDGDLLDEVLDSPGTEREAAVYKPGGGRLFTSSGCKMNNDSKNNPGALADIFGDWREEIVVRTVDNAYLRIYTTPIPTTYRIPTLWSDHQYRNAMAWQCVGYNQPPHKSYFLGAMEGITQAPPTNTMTGRVEIANGGSITGQTDGKQVIVCETNDTKISVESGAKPAVAIFNVPSWVQGKNSKKLNGTDEIDYTYYTCTVEGAPFTDATRLVKQGDGILNLPKVDMTHTGNTDIWAGTVNFDGTMKQSALWLNRFAELNSNGGVFKSIKADYASVIRPGGDNSMGSITVENELELGFGSRIVLDLYSDGLKADQINAKSLKVERKTTDAWLNWGPKYLQPVIEVVEHKADGANTLEAGDYIIGKVDEVSGSLANIKIEGVTNLKTGLSVDDAGNLILSLGSIRGASTIIWTGASSSTWDFAKTENFYVADDESQTADIFVKGDAVTFDDSSTKLTVTIGEELSPSNITVNSSKNYTITGNGAIVDGELVKEGKGTLTIKTENTYTGGNYLKGGTVKVSSLSNENKATGNLGAVTTSPAKFTMENGAIIQTDATVTNGSPIKMVGEEGGVINAGANKDFIQNKAFSGTVLTKTGSGWLKTYAAGSSLNEMDIQQGRVQSYSGVPAKKVILSGGEFEDAGGGALSTPIEVPKNKKGTFILGSAYYLAYNNKLTGEGILTINPTNTVSRVRITGNWSQFEGTIKHTNTNIWLPLDNSTGLPNGTLDIAEGCGVTNVAKSYTIGKLTGKGSLNQPISNFQNQSAVSGSNTWKVGNSSESLGDFTFDGIIADGGGNNKSNFEKVGTCKMTVSGSWTTSGTVKVTEGELNVKSGANLGTGALTVAAGGTLAATTTAKKPFTNSSYTINGTLQAGANTIVTTSIVDFNAKNVTFGAQSKLIVVLRSGGNTKLSNIGTLKMTSGATIAPYISESNLTSFSTEEGSEEEFLLWTDVKTANIGDLNFDLPELPYSDWDTSKAKEGILIVRFNKDKYSNYITGIDNIEASETVTVEVLNINGISVNEYTCPMGSVKSSFAKANLPKGIYVLRMKSETGKKGTLKLMK